MAPLRKIVTFYCRFTPSYSAIGYYARGLPWRRIRPKFAGQTWVVTGGSEGIGAAAARAAAAGGATVIVIARSAEKLSRFAASVEGPGRILTEAADLSLLEEVSALVERLARRSVRIDVLINNVGIQKRDQVLTREGFETSFATNLLGHYLFTRDLLERELLTERALVIEVSSGGMYNHPLVVKDLNITGPGYLGVRAYGLSKRAQVVLTRYWRERFAGTGRDFYVMHPGWVDTASVGRSMPRFRAMLKSVLRTHPEGADTIVWLAAQRPTQSRTESIWFDRKERAVHIYAHTPKSLDTAQDLVRFLDARLHREALTT
jgi:dehydrogenase/reductase SDR family protein 12